MLDLLLVAKKIPVHRLNTDENLFMNHYMFTMISLAILSIITAIAMAIFYRHQQGQHAKRMTKCGDIAYHISEVCVIILTFTFIWMAFSFRVTPNFHFRRGPLLIDQHISNNMNTIKHERTNINIYKHDKNDPVAKHRLLINQHQMNRHIKYDNKNAKYIAGPWIHHEVRIPYEQQIKYVFSDK